MENYTFLNLQDESVKLASLASRLRQLAMACCSWCERGDAEAVRTLCKTIGEVGGSSSDLAELCDAFAQTEHHFVVFPDDAEGE